MRFDYDLEGMYIACDCGHKDLVLRVDKDRLFTKNNSGGLLVAMCTNCGDITNASEILARVAEWANRQEPPPHTNEPIKQRATA